MDDRNKIPEVWALLDETTGHNAQVIGVIEALGLAYDKKKIVLKDDFKLSKSVFANPLDNVDFTKSDKISPPWPDILVSCGTKQASIALEIKRMAKKAGKKCFAVQIMWPGAKGVNFDLLAVPEHDNIPFPFNKLGKIIRTKGAPNRINKEYLLQEYQIWSKTIGELASPRIAVLIGGDSRKAVFSRKHAKTLVSLLTEVASKLKASLLISTSRRTKPEIVNFLKEETAQKIGRQIHFHDFGASRANPFSAYLYVADMIVVTGDSISMASEAASTGKPLYIFAPEGNAPEKHSRFHQSLIESGFADYFDSQQIDNILNAGLSDSNKAGVQLQEAKKVAEEIRKRL